MTMVDVLLFTGSKDVCSLGISVGILNTFSSGGLVILCQFEKNYKKKKDLIIKICFICFLNSYFI